MPIYQSVCMKCGAYHEYFKHSSQCYDTPVCCGDKTDKRILTVPMVRPDIAPWDSYISPASGKMITSYKERREDMKATRCRDYEGRESEDRQAARNRKYQEEEEEKKLDKVVRETWSSLPPSKRAAVLKEAG